MVTDRPTPRCPWVTTRRNPLDHVTLFALAVVVAAGLWRCGGGGEFGRTEVDLALREGALPAEERVIRVRQGDDVVLRWTTDEPTSVHLHGYEIEERLRPGVVTTMWFVARAAGRFPITRHAEGGGEERTVGYLDVHPR